MAGSKSNAFETSLLTLLFNNTAIANIGNAGGILPSSAAGSFYIALFTTAPSDSSAGTEANYTGYARKAVARTSSGWTISGNNASNAAAITFDACSAGTNTIVAFAIMTASSSGDMIYWGDLTANLAVSAGIVPEFAIGDLDINED
jgi:hypothetical protein